MNQSMISHYIHLKKSLLSTEQKQIYWVNLTQISDQYRETQTYESSNETKRWALSEPILQSNLHYPITERIQ